MKKQYSALLFLVALAFSCQHCFGQLDPKIAPIINQFKAQLLADVQRDNVHGSISIAIIKDNHIIWADAVGYASSEKDTPADTTTIYRIGSITKTFTATLLMQLVQEGKIKLDDQVENYLPEIKKLSGYADAGKITFRQLASHTSGLKREPDVSGANSGLLEHWESKLLSCIPNSSFNSKPGEQFLYSNIGYAILGLALSRAAGVPYMQMVQQRILDPLHMSDTFFALPNNKRARLAEGMENEKGTINTNLPLQELKGRGYRVPNGGIFSTPTDLAKFVISMIGKPALLSDKSFAEMQEIPQGGKNYGLGLMITNSRVINAIGHNGSVPGYTSRFAIEKNSGYAVILMRNYNVGVTNLDLAALGLLKQLRN